MVDIPGLTRDTFEAARSSGHLHFLIVIAGDGTYHRVFIKPGMDVPRVMRSMEQKHGGGTVHRYYSDKDIDEQMIAFGVLPACVRRTSWARLMEMGD